VTIASWVEKYGKIAAYTTAVVVVTGFLIRFDAKFTTGNQKLADVSQQLSQLQTQVSSLQGLMQDREKYERWRRGYNSRMKRLFNRNGWEYDDVE